ncbi:hypothetical protein SUGI_1021880 [Cryptomeria japonica]|nr:hypothetical protein SUGI_1021880 [Cryptomeria japonica]
MKNEDMFKAKNKGPYTLDGIGVHIIDWKPNFNPRFHTLSENTVWLRLYNCPSDYWHIEITKDIYKELGTLVFVDDILEDRVWGSFIRICINTGQISKIPEEVKIIGVGEVWIQRIDREDQLDLCPECFSREHIGIECEISASILKSYACVETKSIDMKLVKENTEKREANDVEQSLVASMKVVEKNNHVVYSPLVVSSHQQIHTANNESAQALLNLLEDAKTLQKDIITEFAATLSSVSNKAGDFSVMEDETIPPLPVGPTAFDDPGKKGFTMGLEEGEIVSSASKWEEDVEPVANLIMDNTAKGFGKSESHIKIPNFHPKERFQDFVDKNQLLDVASKNGTFTWTNRRTGFTEIAERLDRFLVAGDWLAQNLILESSILPLIGSDHFPICLNVSLGYSEGGHPFQFELMWLRVPDLHDLIAAWWNESVLGNNSMLFKLNKKLKYIKIKIKEWNLSQFQNIHKEKLRVTAELEDLFNFVIKSDMNDVLFQRESSLKFELNEILQCEEIHWRQKSRELWLKDGDRNTKFFHILVIANCSRTRISEVVKPDGSIARDYEDIAWEAIRHFESLMNGNC